VCLCICARLRLCVNKCIVYIWLWRRRNIYVECRVVYCCCYIAQWTQKSTWSCIWVLQNLLLPRGFMHKPLFGYARGIFRAQTPEQTNKQTNNQPFTGNFWIFHYVFDGKYRKYLVKNQNLIATSKRTLAPMCDVLLLRQQAFSLSSLSLSLPTTTYIHTCIDLCKALLLYQ